MPQKIAADDRQPRPVPLRLEHPLGPGVDVLGAADAPHARLDDGHAAGHPRPGTLATARSISIRRHCPCGLPGDPARNGKRRSGATSKAGRLHVGPWYCLPDEFCVGGESLIRNLVLGHRIARRFGRVTKSGYSPFSWGQISQMPQIYRGFGIDVMTFYRGVNTLVAPKSEFVWEGPDGTEIVVSRLAPRPRYNVWYILQRPAYWGAKLDTLNDFEIAWDAGHAPFRMVDEAHATLDYKLAHQGHDYDASVLPAAARQALEEQDDDWSTPHRLWSCGHDSSCPDLRELRMIADASRALGDCADVFPSSMESFEKEIRRSRSPRWPRVTGEMRHTYTKGSSSMLLGWILSARTRIKQDNFRTERELTRYAEPAAAFATFLGTPYPRPFLDAAYEWLLQNHAHDSIGGCACDAVSDDMRYRFRQAREIATCVVEQAMASIAGSIAFGKAAPDDPGLLLLNPTPRKRSEVLSLVLDTPVNWDRTGFEIVDEKGETVPHQVVATESPFQERVHNPNDVFCFVTAHRHDLRVETGAVPGMGYRSFHVRRANRRLRTDRGSLRTGRRTMANEHLRVKINSTERSTFITPGPAASSAGWDTSGTAAPPAIRGSTNRRPKTRSSPP